MPNTYKWNRRSFVGATGAAAITSALPNSAGAVTGQQAMSLAEARRGELVELLSSLVRVQSLSGESAADAQQLVQNYLEQLPYRIEESADRPSRYEQHAEFMHPNPPGDGPFINLIGWPENPGDRQFAIFSHIDTHSMDDGWETEPLEPVIRDRKSVV